MGKQSSVSIYLGKSPTHARTVSMVLSTTTGLNLPPYHIIHDNFFETGRGDPLTKDITIKWKILAGFHKESNRTTFGEMDNISKNIS